MKVFFFTPIDFLVRLQELIILLNSSPYKCFRPVQLLPIVPKYRSFPQRAKYRRRSESQLIKFSTVQKTSSGNGDYRLKEYSAESANHSHR